MYSNIGGKFKVLAQVIAWIGIFFSFIAGINIIVSGNAMGRIAYSDEISGVASVVGFLVIVIGSLFSWLGSFVLYGFGQLVENSDRQLQMLGGISYKVTGIPTPSATTKTVFSSTPSSKPLPTGFARSPDLKSTEDDRKASLYKLLEAGLITPEEYRDKLSRL